MSTNDEQNMIDEVVYFDYEQYKKLLIKSGRPKTTFVSTPMYSEVKWYWSNRVASKYGR